MMSDALMATRIVGHTGQRSSGISDLVESWDRCVARTRELVSQYPGMMDWQIADRVRRDHGAGIPDSMVKAFRLLTVRATPRVRTHDDAVSFLHWAATFHGLIPRQRSYYDSDGRRHVPDLVIGTTACEPARHPDGARDLEVIEVKSKVAGPDSAFKACEQALRYGAVVGAPAVLVFVDPPRTSLLGYMSAVPVLTLTEAHARIVCMSRSLASA
jgi:hypothetical protein